jgi:hypothetical protein
MALSTHDQLYRDCASEHRVHQTSIELTARLVLEQN